jgi:hypothetical protein
MREEERQSILPASSKRPPCICPVHESPSSSTQPRVQGNRTGTHTHTHSSWQVLPGKLPFLCVWALCSQLQFETGRAYSFLLHGALPSFMRMKWESQSPVRGWCGVPKKDVTKFFSAPPPPKSFPTRPDWKSMLISALSNICKNSAKLVYPEAPLFISDHLYIWSSYSSLTTPRWYLVTLADLQQESCQVGLVRILFPCEVSS